MICLHQ